MSTPAPAWSLTDAKARFSELVGTAEREGPQAIMRRGQPTVVVVAMDEWERRTQRHGSLADFFAASPLRNSGLQIERSDEAARDIAL